MQSGIQVPESRAHHPPDLRPTGENFEFWQLWDAPASERVHAAFRGQLDLMLRQSEQAAWRRATDGDFTEGLRARVNAGLSRLYLGDCAGAASVLTATLSSAQERHAPWEEGYASYAMGAVYRAVGEPGPATLQYGAAERLFRECGDSRANGYARLSLAMVVTEAGADSAREHLLAAVDAFRIAGARVGALTALWMMSAFETGRRGSGVAENPRARSRWLPGFGPTAPSGSAGRSEPETDRLAVSLQSLTRREREVAWLLASGLTNRQIAERMSIAERTVDTHVQRILAKLHCATRVQVAVLVAAGCP